MIRIAIAALIACLATLPLGAHQQRTAVSTLSINERTERMEIMHQVPVHDAEHALRIRGERNADIVENAESRRAFARYIADRFVLQIDGAPAELTFVGAEIEGGTLWVYQEGPVPRPDAEILVASRILTDIWQTQENRVNFADGTNVRTLVFRANDGLQQGQFP